MEKELNHRINSCRNRVGKSQFDLRGVSKDDQTFLWKMKELRKLYMKTVENFSKFIIRLNFFLKSEILLGYISLIVIFSMVAIFLGKNLNFILPDYGAMMKFTIFYSNIGIKNHSFDRLQSCVSKYHTFYLFIYF